MIIKKKILLFIFIMLCSGNSFALTNEDVLNFVAKEMNIEYQAGDVLSLKIYFVDQKILKSEFDKINKRTFHLLSAKYGTETAKGIISKIYNNINGIFNPNTNTIYIRKSLTGCRKYSILAHEMAHFFQFNIKNTPAEIKNIPRHIICKTREVEAYNIEKRFLEIYCGNK